MAPVYSRIPTPDLNLRASESTRFDVGFHTPVNPPFFPAEIKVSETTEITSRAVWIRTLDIHNWVHRDDLKETMLLS